MFHLFGRVTKWEIILFQIKTNKLGIRCFIWMLLSPITDIHIDVNIKCAGMHICIDA